MDTQSLLAFTTIAELKSFTEAAEQLHLTQPAVSKRIASLEAQLNCSLFDRIGRQVKLTESGKALLPKAQKILFEIEDAKRALTNLSGVVSGKLALGTSHHIGLHRLPPVLRRFSKAYQDVQLDIKFIDSEQAYDLVNQGSLELGIVTLPPQTPPPLRTEWIWDDPLALLVGPDHKLAQVEAVDLKELSELPAILPSPTTFTRRIVEDVFACRNLAINVSVSTNYLETIKMMVEIGLGWSVLPTSMIDEKVQILPIEGVSMTRKLGVVYHPNHSLSNAAGALLEILRKHSNREQPAADH